MGAIRQTSVSESGLIWKSGLESRITFVVLFEVRRFALSEMSRVERWYYVRGYADVTTNVSVTGWILMKIVEKNWQYCRLWMCKVKSTGRVSWWSYTRYQVTSNLEHGLYFRGWRVCAAEPAAWNVLPICLHPRPISAGMKLKTICSRMYGPRSTDISKNFCWGLYGLSDLLTDVCHCNDNFNAAAADNAITMMMMMTTMMIFL